MRSLLISLFALSILSCQAGPSLDQAGLATGPVIQQEGEANFMNTSWCDVEDYDDDGIIGVMFFGKNGRGNFYDYHMGAGTTSNNMAFTWTKEGSVLRAWLTSGSGHQFMNSNVTFQKKDGNLQMLLKDLNTAKQMVYGICNI